MLEAIRIKTMKVGNNHRAEEEDRKDERRKGQKK